LIIAFAPFLGNSVDAHAEVCIEGRVRDDSLSGNVGSVFIRENSSALRMESGRSHANRFLRAAETDAALQPSNGNLCRSSLTSKGTANLGLPPASLGTGLLFGRCRGTFWFSQRIGPLWVNGKQKMNETGQDDQTCEKFMLFRRL
jgi:hypothetical protein